jgi:hypothetical protein
MFCIKVKGIREITNHDTPRLGPRFYIFEHAHMILCRVMDGVSLAKSIIFR